MTNINQNCGYPPDLTEEERERMEELVKKNKASIDAAIKQIEEGQTTTAVRRERDEIVGGYTGKGAGLSGFVHPGVGPLYGFPTGEEIAEEQRSYDAHQEAGEAGYFDGAGKIAHHSSPDGWYIQHAEYLDNDEMSKRVGGRIKEILEGVKPGTELPLTIDGRQVGSAIIGEPEERGTTASISFDADMPDKYKVPSPAEFLGEAAFSVWDTKPPVASGPVLIAKDATWEEAINALDEHGDLIDRTPDGSLFSRRYTITVEDIETTTEEPK